MSRLLNRDLTRIYLAPRGIAVARRAGLRPAINATDWRDVPDGWEALLEGLRVSLRGSGTSSRIELRLASPLLQLALLPFDPDLRAPDLERLAARTLIARTFGIDEEVRPQRVAMTDARYGEARLVAALDETRARELEATVAAAGCRLTGLVPALVPVFAATRAARGNARGTLALVEGDRVLLVDHENDALLALRVRPWHVGDDLAAIASPLPQPATALRVAPGEKTVAGSPWRDALLQQPRTLAHYADPRVAFAACGS